eukprot:scaffold3271_cov60-Phaeocystis_antarctica.AAC.3
MRRKQWEGSGLSGLRTRRQWEGRRAVSIGLGRRLGQLLVGSRAFLGLRCCASDRGERIGPRGPVGRLWPTATVWR